MQHQHIYSFCGEASCKDAPYHANTEDLVSPAMSSLQVEEYFAHQKEMLGGEPEQDDYVVSPCAESACPNPIGTWLFVRRNDPLMATLRPQHYEAKTLKRYNDTWARA